MDPIIALEVDGLVAHLTLNRPDASNALDRDMARALADAVGDISSMPDVGAVLLTGAGRRFCGGGDLKAMMSAADKLHYVNRLATELDDAFRALADLEVPVVAAVHGAVAGAGLSLMLSCDVVVAAEGTSFVPAYPGVGLTPDCGLSWLLPRAVGQQRALSFLLTNERIGEEVALAWGLVAEVSTLDGLPTRGLERAQALADGPTWALGQTKSLVRRSWSETREQAGRAEASIVTAATKHPDAVTLMSRFTDR
ncbi:MAG: enoyl-CoA hydratase/isomerase family protein [Nocardioides sp.]|uniref:enoyl-CoA hydratase/isomerase family protein n=1 Tax=Nocardioides sp. TaxID=35761 RepID=UPI0032672AE4